MNDNDRVTGPGQGPSASHQSRFSSYSFLLKLSRKMGTIATRSFVDVKEFLQQDIHIDQQERFLAGMPRLYLEKGKEDPVPDSEQVPVVPPDGTTPPVIDSSSEDLERIVSQSHEVLAEANTVFPVTLFPDTVLVDRTTVTIIKRDLFWSSDTMTFRIEDVLNAEVTVGPIFGSLTIASRVMSTTDHFRIDHFWRNDAIRLKRMIQGYIIAQHNKIDVSHLSRDELIRTLDELGHHHG